MEFTDPLGLVKPAFTDPLGLIKKEKETIPSLVQGTAPSAFKKLTDFLTVNKDEDKTKSYVSAGLAEQTGLPASVIYDNFGEVTKQAGLRDQPTPKQMTEIVMGGALAGALVSQPLSSVLIGVGAFATLAEAENLAISKFKGTDYKFMGGKGLSDLLPEQSSETARGIIDIVDLIGQSAVSGGVIKAGKPMVNKFNETFLRNITETYNMPDKVYISAEKIREFHGLGREDVISPDEASLLKTLNMSRQDYIHAVKNGIDVEIPVSKMTEISDKPWVKGLKDFFKVSPYHEIKADMAGKPTAKPKTAGLLESLAPESSQKTPSPVSSAGTSEIPGQVSAKLTTTSVGKVTSPDAPKTTISDEGISGQAQTFKLEPVEDIIELNKVPDTISEDKTDYANIQKYASKVAWEKTLKKIDVVARTTQKDIETQATKELRETREYKAIDYIVKNGGLNQEQLSNEYDEDTIKYIMKKRPGLISKNGKLNLDGEYGVSGMIGFDSGAELIDALFEWKGVEAEKQPLRDRLSDRYKLTDEEKQKFYDMYLEEEAKQLRGLLKTHTPQKQVKYNAGDLAVGELVATEYEVLKAAMAKAAQNSKIAFREGKIEGALKQKEYQIDLNNRLKARKAAKKEIADIKQGIIDTQKNKKLPEEYRNQIRDLLADYDFMSRSKKGEERIESLREYLLRAEAEGEKTDIPISLLNRLERYGKKHWKELSLNELREIYDMAKMLEHIGTTKNKLIARKDKKDFEQVVSSIVNEINTNWPERVEAEPIEAELLPETFVDKVAEAKERFFTELKKPEYIIKALDKWKPLGVVWDSIYRPIQDASNTELSVLKTIMSKMDNLFDPFRPTSLIPDKNKGHFWANKKFKIDGVLQILTKEQMIMVALNAGNDGNLEALRSKWTDEQISSIVNKLTPEEKTLVEGIWKIFDEQFPLLADTYKKLTGNTLKKIDGKYFPLVFDRSLSWLADKRAAETEAKDFFKSIYTKPVVKTGSVIERIGGNDFPKLSFNVIFDKLSEVNHYASHVLAVRDLNKIINNPSVRAAIETTPAVGTEGYKQLNPWLQDIAHQQKDPLSLVEAGLKYLRKNTTVVALGLKASVQLMQFLGSTQSINRQGADFVQGVLEFYTNRESLVNKIHEQSPEMADRKNNLDRELKDFQNQVGLEYFKGSSSIRSAFFSGIVLLDMMVAYPTWVAGYNRGLKQFNGDEAKAIYFADQEVRNTQSNSLIKDMAAIQRGSELKKWIAMFYTYMSGMQNEMAEAWMRYKYKDTGFGDFANAWFWVIIAPAYISHLMRERELPSVKDLLVESVQYRFGSYPVIRDLMSDYDYKFSPAVRGLTVGHKIGKELLKIGTEEDVDTGRLALYGVEGSGYVFGLPSGQALISIKGFIDLKNGETSDPTRLLLREPREED